MERPSTPPDARVRLAVRPLRADRLRGDRLRWGLTGLAGVFLIVLIAAASLRPTGREAQPGAGEPLAVLGVAPGPATRPDSNPDSNPAESQ